jgi:chromosome segregation protein
MSAARAQAGTFGGERGQIAIEFESVSQRIATLTTEIAQTRDLLELKRRRKPSQNHLDSLRAKFAALQGSSLEAVIAEHGYSTESVRRLFQWACSRAGSVTLADFLEVDPRYEGVVEDFLRDELNYVVVKSWDAADEAFACCARM